MPLTITLNPGYSFDEITGETITLAKLNLLGTPQIGASYTFNSGDFAQNTIERNILKAQAEIWGTDTGTADAHIVDTAPNAYASLTGGVRLYYLANLANTGGVTLALDNMPAKDIYRAPGVPLISGDIVAGQLVGVVYDLAAEVFYLLTPTAQHVASPNGTAEGDVVDWDAGNSKWATHKNRVQKFAWVDSSTIDSQSGPSLSIAHGLTDLDGNDVVPDVVEFALECVDSEYGYAVGDVVFVRDFWEAGGSNVANTWANDTHIGLTSYFPSALGWIFLRKDTANAGAITATKWKLIANAYVKV